MTAAYAANLVEDLPPGDVKRVIGVFQIEIVTLCQRLAAAAAKGDATAFRRAAHAIAGAAGAVGAIELEREARQLMQQSSGSAPDLTTNCAHLAATVASTQTGLAAFVANGCVAS